MQALDFALGETADMIRDTTRRFASERIAPVERFARDAKLLDIGAGTNEIRRMLIGRELIGAGS